MRNEWKFWNRWARQLEKREQSGAPNARLCRSRSLRRSTGFGNRVAVALDWRWAYVAFQRGARPIADVRESLGEGRENTIHHALPARMRRRVSVALACARLALPGTARRICHSKFFASLRGQLLAHESVTTRACVVEISKHRADSDDAYATGVDRKD